MTAAARPSGVDVVIPVRNGARFLVECLDSVRAQTLQPDKVIVVDDGSSDDTPKILADYARRWSKLHLLRSVPRGVSHARNLALAVSQATFIAFLDADDIWHPEKLERQIALFTPDRLKPGFVHCGWYQIDETGQRLNSRVFVPQRRGDIFKAMIEKFYHVGSPSAVVARRELIQTAGGFDEMLVCAEDMDLWQRLARLSHIDYVPETLVALRAHDAGTYSRAIRINPELVLFQRLMLWERRAGEITDDSMVLAQFRSEAVFVSMSNMLRLDPRFGVYGRLKRSELALARRLFPRWRDYLQIARRLRILRDRLKSAAVWRIILPNPMLLRICQAFGRLKNPPRARVYIDTLDPTGRL